MSFRLPTEPTSNAPNPGNENAVSDGSSPHSPRPKTEEANRAYYAEREAIEKLAAKSGSKAARSAHEELAKRYAALARPEQG